eukprot:scaffold118566_cov20-Tisochrysis_lutea.AAC.1
MVCPVWPLLGQKKERGTKYPFATMSQKKSVVAIFFKLESCNSVGRQGCGGRACAAPNYLPTYPAVAFSSTFLKPLQTLDLSGPAGIGRRGGACACAAPT